MTAGKGLLQKNRHRCATLAADAVTTANKLNSFVG